MNTIDLLHYRKMESNPISIGNVLHGSNIASINICLPQNVTLLRTGISMCKTKQQNTLMLYTMRFTFSAFKKRKPNITSKLQLFITMWHGDDGI